MGQVFNAQSWSGLDLAGHDFSSSVLNSCDFSGADLRGSSFASSVLNSCDFSGADLTGCDFRRAVLNGCDMDGADTDGADFSGARLPGNVSGGLSTSVTFGGISVGNVTLDGTTDIRSGSVIGSNNVVHMSSGGVSHIPFDPWVRVFCDGDSFRIETIGTNIKANGSYTFENDNRFIHVGFMFPHQLVVSIGRKVNGTYERTTQWELSNGEWCEIDRSHF